LCSAQSLPVLGLPHRDTLYARGGTAPASVRRRLGGRRGLRLRLRRSVRRRGAVGSPRVESRHVHTLFRMPAVGQHRAEQGDGLGSLFARPSAELRTLALGNGGRGADGTPTNTVPLRRVLQAVGLTRAEPLQPWRGSLDDHLDEQPQLVTEGPRGRGVRFVGPSSAHRISSGSPKWTTMPSASDSAPTTAQDRNSLGRATNRRKPSIVMAKSSSTLARSTSVPGSSGTAIRSR